MSSTTDVDVLVIGAGLSGIGAGYRLRQRLPGTGFLILEGRDAIGGTWDLFRYPGVRSDSAMFTFGYPFRPWREDRTMADGASVRRYIADTAREAGLLDRIRFRTWVRSASWASAQARWSVETDTDEGPVTYRCRFLYLCTGYFDYAQGYQPDWPGLADFGGPVIHPQFWPEGLDVAGRRVVVVGSGATAVTLVPALAERGATVTMLQRSPSYVLSMPATDGLAGPLRAWLPGRAADTVLRAKSLLVIWGFHQFCRLAPAAAKRLLRRGVLRGLGDPAAVDEHFKPRYQPWDQRLCIVPEGDLFTVLADGRARVVTDRIERFGPDGIRLASGRTLPADVVVSATGLVLRPLGGLALTVDGEPVDVPNRYAYRGLMLSGVPNLAFCAGYTNASWTLRADLVTGYVIRLLRHLRRHGMDSATPVTPPDRPRPLLDLTSGYVRRGSHLFPVSGERGPWRVRQNALLERVVLPRADVTAAMSFARGARGAATADVRWVTVRGARIRVRLDGSTRRGDRAAPVLLLHGIGRSLEDWAEQQDRLAGEFRLVAPDLPGFGRSQQPPGPVSLRAEAELLWEVLDALGEPGPVHLVGHSLGGAVALQLLALDPGRVASLALASSAGFGAEVSLAMRVLAVPGLGRRMVGRPHPKIAVRTLRNLFADPTLVTPDRLELALDLSRHPDRPRTYLAMARELGSVRGIKPQWRADLLATAAQHPLPTLVLWGDRDRVLPAAHLQAARAAFPHGRFALLERTGHMPQIERPDEFARLLREHLRAAQVKAQPFPG